MSVTILLIVGLLTVVLAGTALGSLSSYRVLPFQAATTYDSVARSDWYGNYMQNAHSANIYGRIWTYNTATSTYVVDTSSLIAPAATFGYNFPRQQSKQYCRRTSGGADTPGSCTGEYGT